ncbi:hypothetical protein SAMN05661096_04019 [Marivirga sericea]|uniref:Uncharacterized protein n=1 Tax=Marivirga sericea TaxID=1028 RepID=A0A1X7LH04_9BACT|nr:hypothetical protein [Marivirga sericea]SMG52827.1 hypothetical protein SAMN05661096_04019 [Marivirga sericea]
MKDFFVEVSYNLRDSIPIKDEAPHLLSEARELLSETFDLLFNINMGFP